MPVCGMCATARCRISPCHVSAIITDLIICKILPPVPIGGHAFSTPRGVASSSPRPSSTFRFYYLQDASIPARDPFP